MSMSTPTMPNQPQGPPPAYGVQAGTHPSYPPPPAYDPTTAPNPTPLHIWARFWLWMQPLMSILNAFGFPVFQFNLPSNAGPIIFVLGFILSIVVTVFALVKHHQLPVTSPDGSGLVSRFAILPNDGA